MADLADLFPGYESRWIETSGGRLFARVGLDAALAFAVPPDAPVAPTEQCPWRGRLLRGEVHDENASAFGGVAGHAGLFGTLRGACGYARALLSYRLHPSAVVGYLAQEPQLDPTKTVGENVQQAFGALQAAVERFNEISARFAEPMDDEEMNAIFQSP